MIEDDFYCTLKLKSGEEIFAKIAASDEGNRTMLLVSNPVVIEEIKMRNHLAGYKFEPWIKTSTEDMFIINLEDVLTMSESEDVEMIVYYQDFIRKSNKRNRAKLDKKMGYISSVNDAKEVLEKLYNSK
tara:strand:+ start:609 stop:995 length:387 start_codon:yes stop_codon:yes gene_type:complete